MATIQEQINGLAVAIRNALIGQSKILQATAALYNELRNGPKSITQEIDAIPGRRIEYCLSGGAFFDANDDGLRGDAITLLVSQDGPFVATHYPQVIWRPTAPTTATNFGRWRPVTSWPLPDQVVDADIIDLSYEIVDGGSQRNFQSAARGPIFSRPDALEPLPVPTLFAPNAAVQFFPTFQNILFDGATPPTQGWLQVDIPGYRIVNL